VYGSGGPGPAFGKRASTAAEAGRGTSTTSNSTGCRRQVCNVLPLEQARVRECRVNSPGQAGALIAADSGMTAPLRSLSTGQRVCWRHVPGVLLGRPGRQQARGWVIFIVEALWQQSGALAITYPGATIHGAEPVKRAETRSASQQARRTPLASKHAKSTRAAPASAQRARRCLSPEPRAPGPVSSAGTSCSEQGGGESSLAP
jgi:hypothetical protein